MPAQHKVSALRRKLTGLLRKFLNHPQRVKICLAVYAFCVGIFLITAAVGLDVSPGLAVAYFIGLTAIGFSAYAIHRMSQISTLATSSIPVGCALAPPPLVSRHFVVDDAEVLDIFGEDESGLDILDDEPADPVPAEYPDDRPFAEEDYRPSDNGPELVFTRSPVVTLPHRRVAIIRGDMMMSDGNQYPASDELRFAHAVAFAAQNPAAQGRSIMIPLSMGNLTGQFMDDALDLIDTMPGLAERIIFELPSETPHILDPGLIAVLSNLRGEGFRFAAKLERMPVLTDFITHGPLWSEFSHFLMTERQIFGAGEDIIRLFDPLGVKIIALDIKSDADIVEVLEFDVPLAAGPLFEAAPAPAAATPPNVASPAPDERPAAKPRKRIAERKPPTKTGRLHTIRKQLDTMPEEQAKEPKRKRAAAKK